MGYVPAGESSLHNDLHAEDDQQVSRGDLVSAPVPQGAYQHPCEEPRPWQVVPWRVHRPEHVHEVLLDGEAAGVGALVKGGELWISLRLAVGCHQTAITTDPGRRLS